MAATSGNTRVLSPEEYRRKRKKNKPKGETKVDKKAGDEFRGKWQVADVDYGALKLDELREFMGMEELSSFDHEVITANTASKRSKNRNKRHRKLASQLRQTAAKRKTPPTDEPSLKKKKTTPNHPGQSSNQSAANPTPKGDKIPVDCNPNDRAASSSGSTAPLRQRTEKRTKSQKHNEGGLTGQRVAKGDGIVEDGEKVAMDTKSKSEDNNSQKRKGKASSYTKGIPVPKKDKSVDMSAWKNLNIPAPVLEALQDLGFKEPTPIQKVSIPAAIKEGKDIVGAAETGSGKTLAFGIPVIHNILQHKAALQREVRSKAYKEANMESTASTKPLATTNEGELKPRETHPKKEMKALPSPKTDRHGAESSLAGEERTEGRASQGKRTVQDRKIETKRAQEDQDDEEDEEESFDGDDEDIEYDIDDDEENVDYGDDDDESDDGDNDASDIDFDEDEVMEDEDASGEEGEDDSAEDDNDDNPTSDIDEEDAGLNVKKGKKKDGAGGESPTDQPPKKPKGKKGQRKRRFRIQERKLLELDGEEFEGIELINKMEKRGFGCVRAIDDISEAEMLSQIGSGADAGLLGDTTSSSLEDRQLYAMILMPTRELAVQVKNHLDAVAKYTDIKIAVIVGGMSAQKQERILKKQPEIVIGTPGRIWELFREGEPHLSTMSGVRCLVLDEADRMVEKGHYEQLTEILHQMNRSPSSLQRQTFVFSATLTLVHLGPDRKTNKTDRKKNTPKQDKKDRKVKLNSLMKKIGIRDDPVLVDLTQKQGTVASLMEAKIICDVSDKDIYLYYFLLQFPGRTLVFSNSIDCIRRLCSILTLLACNPLPLHSSMHQKQRLKNLDRFASNPKALLLATDVAARGLDIPDVEHVIHYQVPRTSEIYIHRSGRTARQAKEGVSIMLVSSSEANFYRRVCRTLNRDDIASFPVNHMYYNAVKEIVDMARLIDQTSHRVEKKKHANEWFIKAAKEMDVDLDEDLVLHDLGDSHQQMQHDRNIQFMKGELKALLKRKICPRGSSWLYPTAQGRLISPLVQGTASAFTVVKKKIGNKTKDASQSAAEPAKKIKKSKNKFKQVGDG